MGKIKLCILTILFLHISNLFASLKDSLLTERDSLLILDLKRFIANNTGFELDRYFYTSWSRSEKPYVILYVSSSRKVEPAGRFAMAFGTQEEFAKKKALEYEESGYHAFVYKTYATVSAELNKRFVSYPVESKCFIMFHEFFHHYKRDLKLAIPIEFEEALSDVIGNYGTMEFIHARDYPITNRFNKQKSRDEKIYSLVNKTIDRINLEPEQVNSLNHKCQKRIEKILKKADQFQKDRFGYHVNNGYLLKNSFYSKNYFMLKRVFQKSGTLIKFLKVIEACPAKAEDFEKYIKGFQ